MRPHLGLAMGFVSLAATAADRTRRIARRGQLRILEFRRPAHDHRRGLFDEAQPLAGRNRRQRRHGARLVQGPAADRDEDRPDPGLYSGRRSDVLELIGGPFAPGGSLEPGGLSEIEFEYVDPTFLSVSGTRARTVSRGERAPP